MPPTSCRPTQYCIRQTQGTEFIQPEFDDCRLYLGGDVGRDTLHLLHGVEGLQVRATHTLQRAANPNPWAAKLGVQ